MIVDSSDGYEAIADTFMMARSDVGADVVRRWARRLPKSGIVVDVGCGTGAREIQAAAAPLLVLQGDLDEVVPLSQAQEIFAASPAASKSFVIVPGAHHNDLRISVPPAMPALKRFTESAIH